MVFIKDINKFRRLAKHLVVVKMSSWHITSPFAQFMRSKGLRIRRDFLGHELFKPSTFVRGLAELANLGRLMEISIQTEEQTDLTDWIKLRIHVYVRNESKIDEPVLIVDGKLSIAKFMALLK